jgi:hypothetical protein
MLLLSQNAQRPLFHLLGLCGGLVEPRLEVRPSMLPGHVDGGFHVVGQRQYVMTFLPIARHRGIVSTCQPAEN